MFYSPPCLYIDKGLVARFNEIDIVSGKRASPLNYASGSRWKYFKSLPSSNGNIDIHACRLPRNKICTIVLYPIASILF